MPNILQILIIGGMNAHLNISGTGSGKNKDKNDLLMTPYLNTKCN